MDSTPDTTNDAKDTVLDAVPAGYWADLHEITAQVRLEYPAIRLTEVAALLLGLSGESRIRISGVGESRRYRRRV